MPLAHYSGWETHNKGTVGWQALGDPMLHWYSQDIHSRVFVFQMLHHSAPQYPILVTAWTVSQWLPWMESHAGGTVNPLLDYSAELVRIRSLLRLSHVQGSHIMHCQLLSTQLVYNVQQLHTTHLRSKEHTMMDEQTELQMDCFINICKTDSI